MDRAFDFAVGGCAAGSAVEVGGAAQFGDLAVRVFHHFVTFDDVGVFEADFAAGFEPEEFRHGNLHEIVAFDIEFAAERDLPFAGALVFGIVDSVEFLGFVAGIIDDHHFDRPQHDEPA